MRGAVDVGVSSNGVMGAVQMLLYGSVTSTQKSIDKGPRVRKSDTRLIHGSP